MTSNMYWVKCPVCEEPLPFHEGKDEALAHLLACARKKQAEGNEVADDDQLLLEVEETRRMEAGLDGEQAGDHNSNK